MYTTVQQKGIHIHKRSECTHIIVGVCKKSEMNYWNIKYYKSPLSLILHRSTLEISSFTISHLAFYFIHLFIY